MGGLARIRLASAIALCAVVAAPSIGRAEAPNASDPPFLGIHLGGTFPILVMSVEPDSAAALAGLHEHDLIFRVENQVVSGDDLKGFLSSFHSGDTVHLMVDRGGHSLALDATLSTRQEILQRRFVGRPAPAMSLVDVEDGQVYDVGALHGRPAILAWQSHTCNDCDAIVRDVAGWAEQAARRHGPAPLVLAVTTGERDVLAQAHRSVPVAVAPVDVFDRVAITDDKDARVIFMVVDSHGEVAMISVVAPDDDGAHAAVEDVMAACEQAERHASRH